MPVNTGAKFEGKIFAIKRNQVKDYLNAYFYYYYDLYIKIKTFGLPNDAGWANEPEHIIEAYLIIEREINEIEAERLKESANDNRRSKNTNNT